MPPLLFYEYTMSSLGFKQRDEQRKKTEDNMLGDQVVGSVDGRWGTHPSACRRHSWKPVPVLSP
jgi:hypothetical protein